MGFTKCLWKLQKKGKRGEWKKRKKEKERERKENKKELIKQLFGEFFEV